MTEKRFEPGPGQSALAKLDTGVPHIARVYDYILGGKDNFAADREAAEEFMKMMPSIVIGVRESRAFLTRAVRFLTTECGIDQFLDIGTGLPTTDNTHEVAQRVSPKSRIVYVDNDPMVLSHAEALLASTREGQTTYIHADLRDTDKILDTATDTLDFSRPIAVMLIGVLHCIPDGDDPFGIVKRLLEAVRPGSYLVLGHPANDIDTHAPKATAGLNSKLAAPVTFRGHDEVATFLGGLEVLEPGLVQYSQWRPGSEPRTTEPVSAWCAVARTR